MSPAHSHHFFTPPISTSKNQQEMKSSKMEQKKEAEFQNSKNIETTPRTNPFQFKNTSSVWVVLGLGAVLYMGLVFLRPGLLLNHKNGVQENAQFDTKESASKDLDIVSSQMQNLLKDISDLKGMLSDLTAQQRSLAERVTLMDNKIETTTAKVATLNDVQTNNEKTKSSLKTADLTNADTSKSKKEAAPKPKVIAQSTDSLKIMNATKNTSETQSIETSSVEPTDQQTGSIKNQVSSNKSSSSNLGLQIATGPSIDSLKLSWNVLSENHSDNLKRLQPRYTKSLVGNDVVYNLVVGPVVSEAEAKKMCTDLGAKAIPCDIINSFAGEAL